MTPDADPDPSTEFNDAPTQRMGSAARAELIAASRDGGRARKPARGRPAFMLLGLAAIAAVELVAIRCVA